MSVTANNAYPKTHISLNVRDIERSVAFYEAFFGATAHKRRPGYANFNLSAPPLKLALQEAETNEERRFGSLSHLGVEVETREAVEAFRQRLAGSGLITFDEGDTVCCYARQDKVWVTDPDGNSWEVYVLLDEMTETEDTEFAPGGLRPGVASCSGLPMSVGGGKCCG
jgi:catechol 2,3-dioxygenase-like lactoylglutathione lyase family enzyme